MNQPSGGDVLADREADRESGTADTLDFLECGGNSGSEWAAKNGPDVQRSYGLASCSEWTGVPLRLLLEEVGLKPKASWLIAEGADACRMQRSVPDLTDLSKEPAKTLEMYGPEVKKPGSFAASALLARRMIERGVRVVQMLHRG